MPEKGKQSHLELLSSDVGGGLKRSYFSRFTQEICSSNKGCRTNKQVSGRAAAAGAKAGTISPAAGPPDKSPGRWPYLNTAEPLGSGGQPGPPKVRLCFGLLTRCGRRTDWRMGRRHLSKQVKARARTLEQVLHSLTGFHKEEDSWWIGCSGVHLLIWHYWAGRSMSSERERRCTLEASPAISGDFKQRASCWNRRSLVRCHCANSGTVMEL